MPAYAQIICAAVLFSTGGAAIKACSLSSWQIAGLRSGLAAAALTLLLPAARRRWSSKSLAVGLAHAVTMILYVSANKLTTAMNTIFLQDAAPFYVLLLSPFLLKEPIRLRDVFVMTVIIAGLLMFFIRPELPQETSPNPFVGNILAAVSGISWALTIMGLRWLGRQKDQASTALSAVVVGNVVTFLVCLPLMLPLKDTTIINWSVVSFLGFFQVGLAYVLLTRGVASVPAFMASIILLIEPIMNPIWAFLLHGEVPGSWAIWGSALILAATATKIWWDGRS
jgi:drug/metabolite transporter (DMT)-like permease